MNDQLLSIVARHDSLPCSQGSRQRSAADWLPWLPPPQFYSPETALFVQRSSPLEAYFIEEGCIKLVRASGVRRQILGLRYPGWFVGIASVILNIPHSTTAVTATRCRLQRAPAEFLAHLVRTNSDLSWKLHQMLSGEVLGQDDRLAQLTRLSARQRLERLLYQFVDATHASQITTIRRNAEVWLQLPLKHSDLADLIAVTPPHLSRLFKQLRADGIIRLQKGWVIISDHRRLRDDRREPASRPWEGP